MSVETHSSTEETGIEDLAGELGESIARTEEYAAYEAAQAKVKESEHAQGKIDEFEALRQEFMLARQTGDATQEDLRKLQRAQQELHEIPVMAEYLEAQAKLDAKLEAINEAISDHLSVDFGEQAGGCCQD
ncbi:YlbF family regulator [Halalkalicoccus sp. NIPERK01]|uniref:YlbF family regulator n=1 Tax=Halalkalicoccus sp. NIPERK01 TaxID=3053469 RepID=UPI00256F604F|nr:YlbF family regulator [Halalkalicoccus sp. NIPERK01]MDL5360738.1 YlbF family regulator [Halalkalicoccus sp. NIPERK01]